VCPPRPWLPRQLQVLPGPPLSKSAHT
jgi:hypothetical protein